MRKVALLAVALVACSKSTPQIHVEQPVGHEGGTVAAPDGTTLTFPPGAVPDGTTISIQSAPEAPPPPSTTIVGTPYVFGPEGTQFSTPVTVKLPVDASKIPTGATLKNVVIYTAPAGSTAYELLPTALSADGQHVEAQTSHFSIFLTGVTFDETGMPTSPDFAMEPDLAPMVVVDLAQPPDLTTVPDLAVPPDMAMPAADMAMNPPADMSMNAADQGVVVVPDMAVGQPGDMGKDAAVPDLGGGGAPDLAHTPDFGMPNQDMHAGGGDGGTKVSDMAIGVQINGLNPSEARAGSGDLWISVSGYGFGFGAVVNADGTPLETTQQFETMRAKIPSSMLAAAGSLQITVSANGNLSNALVFNVVASGGNALPMVSAISPSSVALGGMLGGPISISGSQFVTGASIFVGGIDATSGASVQASQINMQMLPQQILGAAGTYPVVVQNPAPGGGASVEAVAFTVTGNNPSPSFTVSPSTVPRGGMAQFSLVATSGSSWFTSRTTLTVTFAGQTAPAGQCQQYSSSCNVNIPWEAVQQAGTVTITATTPAPGGGVASADFTVTDGNVLLPAEAHAGSGALNVLVWGAMQDKPTGGPPDAGVTFDGGVADLSAPQATGSGGFNPSSVVNVDGVAVPTHLVDGQYLSFTLPASSLASPGTLSITVTTDGVTGPASTFTVTNSGNPLPVVSSVTPASSQLGMGGGGPLTINGSSFLNGAKVYVGGIDVTQNAMVSPNQVQIQMMPQSVTGAAGSYPIVVQNPAPGGGASDGSVAYTVTGSNPQPGFTVSPAQVPLGAYAPTVLNAIDASHSFTSRTTLSVSWNGGSASGGTCSYYGTTCSVQLPYQALQQAGTVTITATTPAPGGGVSSASFEVVAGNVLLPSEARAGSGNLLVQVWMASPNETKPMFDGGTGGGPTDGGMGGGGGPSDMAAGPMDMAMSAPVVNVNGSPVPSSMIDPQHVSFTLTQAQLANPGTLSITVTANGVTSAPSTFSIVTTGNALPVVSSVSPSSIMRGQPPMGPIMITGSGFVSGAVVTMGGINVANGGPPPTVISDTQIRIDMPPYQLSNTAGAYPIVVQNPAPGGGASNSNVVFIVQ